MKKKRNIFFIVIAVFFGIIFIKQQFIINNLNKEYKDYNSQLAKVKTLNKELQQELAATQKNDYIEKLARQKLGLIKPGEILFRDKSK